MRGAAGEGGEPVPPSGAEPFHGGRASRARVLGGRRLGLGSEVSQVRRPPTWAAPLGRVVPERGWRAPASRKTALGDARDQPGGSAGRRSGLGPRFLRSDALGARSRTAVHLAPELAPGRDGGRVQTGPGLWRPPESVSSRRFLRSDALRLGLPSGGPLGPERAWSRAWDPVGQPGAPIGAPEGSGASAAAGSRCRGGGFEVRRPPPRAVEPPCALAPSVCGAAEPSGRSAVRVRGRLRAGGPRAGGRRRPARCGGRRGSRRAAQRARSANARPLGRPAPGSDWVATALGGLNASARPASARFGPPRGGRCPPAAAGTRRGFALAGGSRGPASARQAPRRSSLERRCGRPRPTLRARGYSGAARRGGRPPPGDPVGYVRVCVCSCGAVQCSARVPLPSVRRGLAGSLEPRAWLVPAADPRAPAGADASRRGRPELACAYSKSS